MPTHLTPGRSLVTRRAVGDVVRAATLGSYGVTGFAANPLARFGGALGLGQPGLRLALARGIVIELHLSVAYGVPIAEVARQVDSAVRYAVRRSTGRDVDRLTIHVGSLRYQPGALPSARPARAEGEAGDGTDPGGGERDPAATAAAGMRRDAG